MTPHPRIAMDVFAPAADSLLRFGSQLGVHDVVVYGHTFTSPGQVTWTELSTMRARVEAHGMRIASLESFPARFYDRVMFGEDGRDEQLTELRRIIQHTARAGIDMIGYHWMPSGVWRTSYHHAQRGGSRATAFDLDLARRAPLTRDREWDEADMWAHYEYFLEAVLPVAEEEGVTLALHPNDPPVASLGGVPCLLRDPGTIDRALALRPSDAHQVIMCLGTWGAMDVDLVEVVEKYGARRKIGYVHFQASNGTVPRFNETFVDCADTDPLGLVRALVRVGFGGVMMPSHVPQTEGDTEWRTPAPDEPPGYAQPTGRQLAPLGGHRARAYTFGYLNALLHAEGVRPSHQE